MSEWVSEWPRFIILWTVVEAMSRQGLHVRHSCAYGTAVLVHLQHRPKQLTPWARVLKSVIESGINAHKAEPRIIGHEKSAWLCSCLQPISEMCATKNEGTKERATRYLATITPERRNSCIWSVSTSQWASWPLGEKHMMWCCVHLHRCQCSVLRQAPSWSKLAHGKRATSSTSSFKA